MKKFSNKKTPVIWMKGFCSELETTRVIFHFFSNGIKTDMRDNSKVKHFGLPMILIIYNYFTKNVLLCIRFPRSRSEVKF